MKRMVTSTSIQFLLCPRCHAAYSFLGLEEDNTFVCDECGAEFEVSRSHSGLKLIPIVYDKEK